MSASQGPKKVLSRTINEATAPPHDLIITWASSIPTDRLLPLDEWLRADCPTNQYTGPRPTYRSRLDWSDVDECGLVQVVNRAMEQCFGARGMPGWEIWIRGDQLNLLMGDFRKMYLKLKALKQSEIGLLEIWVDNLLGELKRIHSLPPSIPSPADGEDASSLLPKPTDQPRRSSRSPSRMPRADQAPYPRVLPMENIGRFPPTFRSKSHSITPRAPTPSPPPPPMSPVSQPRPSPSAASVVSEEETSPVRPPLIETDNEEVDHQTVDSDDEVVDADEVEDSDEGDEYIPGGRAPDVLVIDDSEASNDSGGEGSPIWTEHASGPSRTRRSQQPVTALPSKTNARSLRAARSVLNANASTSQHLPNRSNSSRRLRESDPHLLQVVESSTKRKGPPQDASRAKRPRVQQISRTMPVTPESNPAVHTASQGTHGTGTTNRTGTEGPTDVDTPTPKQQNSKESKIWEYYIEKTPDVGKNKTRECRACGKIVKGRSTSNFLDHQRTRCTGLIEAARRNLPGIMCDIPTTASQTTIAHDSCALIQPFNHRDFLAAVMKWIIVSGLPFTTIQNAHLQKAFQVANPDARLQSARTLARKLEDTYDIVSDRVINKLKTVNTTLHYSHDSWTDSGRKHCYFGIYTTYVDDNFEYQEVLLRLLHMKGKHTGVRMGNGLFDLFHNVVGVAGRLGPGTGDNASNNRTAANRLAQLIETELLVDYNGADMVGCLCHIANIAALKYLAGESELTSTDYAYAPENVPEIRILGESPFWTADLEETPTDDDIALLEPVEGHGEVETHEMNVSAMDRSEAVDVEDEGELEESGGAVGQSPVDMVHQLGIYVHSSPQRMEEFEKTRAIKNPETAKGLLPLKDVVTRWNSKEAAIARMLRLRATVESFTTRSSGRNCPRFNKTVFDALETIQPSLKIFLQLTQVYSEVGAHSYRIIPDLINAIDQLRELHSHPSVAAARRKSSEAAIDKLSKYLKRFLKIPWVCAAFALDPTVREEGLHKLLTEEYSGRLFFETTVQWIKARVKEYQDEIRDRNSRSPLADEVKWVQKAKRVNKFASTRYQAGHQEITHDVTDPWECYNSDMKRFETTENEPVLKYWKRMAEYKEMRPLALVARDVLGLASSSASVERLFSNAGHVLGKKRGSLSAKLLAKQTMLRMWETQGLLTTEDL